MLENRKEQDMFLRKYTGLPETGSGMGAEYGHKKKEMDK